MGVTISAIVDGLITVSVVSPADGGADIVVAACLVLLLTYYNLLETVEEYERVRIMVLAAIGPLLLTFCGIVIYESLQLIR